jgi:hypothetical protein
MAQFSGNGWCTHPKRQVASDLKILVREREIACRNTWGQDLWVDNASSSTTTPPSGKTPRAAPRRGFIFGKQRFDDEVTSVVDATSGPGRMPEPESGIAKSDDVVTLTSIRAEDSSHSNTSSMTQHDDHNAAAIADQDERVRHMARGSRDAIFHARARAALRRTPTRPMIEPDAVETDTPSDHILDNRHSDQRVPGQAETPNRSRREASEVTPPVPRSEVEARGDALSPAVGVDTRFDSVPEVKPEVDLPRLRDFFRTDHLPTHQGRGSDGSSRPFSSFDLVVERARAIHGSIDRTPLVNSRFQAPEPLLLPAPALPASEPSPPHNPAVVWDVESDSLDVAFARARAAIEDAPHSPRGNIARHQPVVDELAFADPQLRKSETELRDEAGYALEWDDFQGEPSNGFPSDNDQVLDEYEGSLSHQFDDGYSDTSYIRNSIPESPRTSWWRSLNFGIRRRPDPPVIYQVFADAADYGTPAYDEANDIPEDELPSQDAGHVSQWERSETLDWTPVPLPTAIAATSRESWPEDENQFPVPQPAAWHQARTLLLARQPEPDLAPLRLRRHGAQQPQASSKRRPYHDGSVEEPGLSNRPEPSFFAIDEPGGMDALRSALFDDWPVPKTQNAEVEADVFGRRVATDLLPQVSPRLWINEDRPVDAQPADRRATITGEEPHAQSSRRRRDQQPLSSNFANNQAAFDSRVDIRDAMIEPDEEPDRIFEVSSKVTKSCSTCRSFRSSETGDRGWCENHDAPTYRQMVNADELTCRSSIGFWWLAADTSWIPPVDMIKPETPRTDRLVDRSNSQSESERRDERRVRTSNFS